MTDIILKQGTGVPSDTDVDVAEVALDTSSGAMYTKLADGSVKHLNPVSGGGGGGGDSLWEQNGDDIYYNSGNVGIGTDSPSARLHTAYTDTATYNSADPSADIILSRKNTSNTGSQTVGIRFDVTGWSGSTTGGASIQAVQPSNSSSADLAFLTRDTGSWSERMRIDASGTLLVSTTSSPATLATSSTESGLGYLADGYLAISRASNQPLILNRMTDSGTIISLREDGAQVGSIGSISGNGIAFGTGELGNERMRIDASGRVGIGGQPSRSAEEIAKEAKDTLSRWKSTFDERLKAEPKADKKAVTLEITGDEFDTFPSEETLVERLQERNIDGGDAKLQVSGNGYFNDSVIVNQNLVVRYGHINLSRYCAWQALDDITDSIRFGASNANMVGNGRAYGYEAYTTGEVNYTNLRWCIGVKIRDQHDPDTFKDVEEVFNIDNAGNVNAKGDVVAYSSSVSDARLKDNVETIDNALDKVCALRGVSYTWNQGSREGQQDIGVIAQEVETVFPEIVREHEMPLLDGETYKTVDYQKLCGVLIEAVKELSARIEELEHG